MLKLVPPPKIPSTCRGCKENLHEDDMNAWLDLCEIHGKDPMEAVSTGILCFVCMFAALCDGAEDGDEELKGLAKKFLSNIRRNERNMKVVKP